MLAKQAEENFTDLIFFVKNPNKIPDNTDDPKKKATLTKLKSMFKCESGHLYLLGGKLTPDRCLEMTKRGRRMAVKNVANILISKGMYMLKNYSEICIFQCSYLYTSIGFTSVISLRDFNFK